MGHSKFEITEAEVRFDATRLDALIDAAKVGGYLEDHDPADADETENPAIAALRALLGEFFDCNYDLDEELVLTNPDFDWYEGDTFPQDTMCELFAMAAMAGSRLTFLDFDDYTRDIYEVIFDGEGGYRREPYVIDGVPVRRAG
jgi:hypothetical protein